MVINKSKYPPNTSYNIWINEPSGFCSFKNFKEPVVFFIKELAVLWAAAVWFVFSKFENNDYISISTDFLDFLRIKIMNLKNLPDSSWGLFLFLITVQHRRLHPR